MLSGVNGVFCSGADLKYIRAGGDAEDLGYLSPDARETPAGYGERFKQILEYIHSTISEIRRAPKPFIAAVDGVAAAGGFGLAMCCDLVVASERSVFEWAYSKTGLTGAESSTFMLPRLVGFRRAMELVLLNPRLDAARALQLGLINDVFPTETFDEECSAIAKPLAAGPTEAFAVAKGLINQAAGMDRLDVHLDRELDISAASPTAPSSRPGSTASSPSGRRSFRGSSAMHEYSIVQALIERVDAEARARRATAVHRLSMRIGELSGVEVELLTTAYETFRERTICAGAELECEHGRARDGSARPAGARSAAANCCPARLRGARAAGAGRRNHARSNRDGGAVMCDTCGCGDPEHRSRGRARQAFSPATIAWPRTIASTSVSAAWWRSISWDRPAPARRRCSRRRRGGSQGGSAWARSPAISPPTATPTG